MGKQMLAAAVMGVLILPRLGVAATKPPPLADKKILMVIAPGDFRDEELAAPRRIMENAGAAVTLASTTREEVRGMLGMKVKPDKLLKEVRAADFDGLVFVGGVGAQALFEDPDAHRLAREGVEKHKIVSAICIAPCILARAGVLRDRPATVWPGKEFVRILEQNGAHVRRESVVEDGRLITANGPEVAQEFGETLVKALAAASAAEK